MNKEHSFVTLSIITTAIEGKVVHHQIHYALDEVHDFKVAVCISHHRHYRIVAVPLSTSYLPISSGIHAGIWAYGRLLMDPKPYRRAGSHDAYAQLPTI